MIRRSDITVLPDGVTPEPWVYITVKDDLGALATLYADDGSPLGNPLNSGSTGAFHYNILNVDAGPFIEEYRLSLLEAPRKIVAITYDAVTVGYADGITVTQTTLLDTMTGMSDGDLVRVVSGIDGGWWKWHAGNLSAVVTAYPGSGLWRTQTGDPLGFLGAFERQVERDKVYSADWWLRGLRSNPQDILNQAIKQLPAGATLRFPDGHFLMTRAAAGTVTPGSSSHYGGIIGAVYIDKDYITIDGCGDSTFLDGQGSDLNIFMYRASHGRIRDLKYGNVAGQLSTNESAGVVFQPSNFVQGSGVGADIEDIIVERCLIVDVDTGVTAVGERDGSSTPQKMWLARGVKVRDNRVLGYRRQCVELFNPNGCEVNHNYATGADKGAYVYSRFARIIGAQDVRVHHNEAHGFSGDTAGYISCEVSLSAYYSDPEFFMNPQNVEIDHNEWYNFWTDLYVTESRQWLTYDHNNSWNTYSTSPNSTCVIVASIGKRDGAGDNSLGNKYQVSTICVTNNQCMSKARFFTMLGRTITAKITDNTFIGNGATDTCFSSIALTAGHPLEQTYKVDIERNTAYMNPAASSAGVNRFTGMNTEAVISFNGNKMTPSTTGAIFVHSGNGTVAIRSPTSNTILPNDIWTTDFAPPLGEMWGGN